MIMFIKNLMRKLLYIISNIMNIYTLNQFYCSFKDNE